MSPPNVVDSSCWLEYFGNTTYAPKFAPVIEDTGNLIVPVICVYEVFKKVRLLRGGDDALTAASTMQAGRIIDMNISLAVEAAHYKVPLADSIIYATAQKFGATLWTQDKHFKDLPDVRYFAK